MVFTRGEFFAFSRITWHGVFFQTHVKNCPPLPVTDQLHLFHNRITIFVSLAYFKRMSTPSNWKKLRSFRKHWINKARWQTLGSYPYCHLSILRRSCYYTPISKKVVGENGEWQLSKGDCTTERNCGFWILMINNQLSKLVNDAGSI